MRYKLFVPWAGVLLLALVMLAGSDRSPLDAQVDPARLSAGTGSLLLQVPADVSVGDGFTVTLVSSEMSDPLSAFQFILTFDPGILAFHGASSGGFLGSTGRTVVCPPARTGDGSVRLACGSAGEAPGPTGAGELLTLHFSALAAGQSGLNLSGIQLVDGNRPPGVISATAQNASITVKDSPQTAPPTELFLPALHKGASNRSLPSADQDDIFLPRIEGASK